MTRTARIFSTLMLSALAIAPALMTAPLRAQDAAAPATATRPLPGKKHIYFEEANPRADIKAALATARRTHKRVILDFGGDWCPDCQVLDIYFHQEPNAALLEKKFILVHVWIGHMDKNIDLAAEYGVPLKGVPALAVLDGKGKVVYSQRNHEFSNMRAMDAESVTEFLEKWKG